MQTKSSANLKQNEYRFMLSCDVTHKVRIKICNLEGKRKRENLNGVPSDTLDKWIEDPFLRQALYSTQYSSLFVTCVLYADGKPLCLPEQTSHHSFVSNQYRWDETLVFPVKYQDLPSTTQMVMTLWDVYSPRNAIPVGGTTFYLFGKNRILRKGRQKLFLYADTEGDGSEPSKTPGKLRKSNEIDRLEKLMKRYDRGLLPHVDWIDNFTRAQVKKSCRNEMENTDSLYLFVECFEFEYPVVFKEPIYQGHVQPFMTNSVVVVVDPELTKDNPVELKYLKLARSNRMRNLLDRDLKPNNLELKQLTQILRYPPSKHLALEEKEILWKFRYYLSNNKKALTKFLKCIDWTDAQEAKQAVDMMTVWEPIELDDALELISVSFPDERVRRYAVTRLEKADDEELLYYILQLVQAMKYEKTTDSPLINFIISRAAQNFELGDYFYWYLTVEANLKNSKYTKFYMRVVSAYSAELQKNTRFTKNLDALHKQDWLMRRLTALFQTLTASGLERTKRIEKLRQMLGPKGEFEDLANFPPLPLPLNPNIEVVGINPDNAHIFKSAKAPLGLKFKTVHGTEYGVIFKNGDDLRQDQLIIQLISLMDRLLKKENMNLKLTPYKVLATAEEDGMVEQIPSEALASVIKNYDGNIQKFLKSHNPEENMPEALDNFVKSCAGYCVITYILGIGDRHLDNLLLTKAGNLFHIDFGFILGADPKPLPPPMKLCKEMVDGMGGRNSLYYNKFRQYCCEAFNILRKSSNLILNLFSLMRDSAIVSISTDPEKSVLKVQEKFRLELTDEEASANIDGLLEESVSALFPVLVEYIHSWAQYWRS